MALDSFDALGQISRGLNDAFEGTEDLLELLYDFVLRHFIFIHWDGNVVQEGGSCRTAQRIGANDGPLPRTVFVILPPTNLRPSHHRGRTAYGTPAAPQPAPSAYSH